MNTMDPSFAFFGSLCAGGAAGLTFLWLGQAWDAFAQQNIADVLPRFRAMGFSEEQISYWMRGWGLAMAGVMLVMGVLMGMFPVALGITFLIFVAPRFLLDRLIRQRRTQLRDQLVRASVGVANGCRAGMSLEKSIEKILPDTRQPLANELRRIVRDYKGGATLEQSLRETQNRLNLEAFTVFASSIIVARKRGGDITFALERISHGLQEMQRLDGKLESESASGRKLAMVLSAFPVVFLALFSLLDPQSTGLLYTTLIGQIILVIIGAMVYFAAKWCFAILNMDF